MSQLWIKTEMFPTRCEVCHQADYFDPQKNVCTRCISIPRSNAFTTWLVPPTPIENVVTSFSRKIKRFLVHPLLLQHLALAVLSAISFMLALVLVTYSTGWLNWVITCALWLAFVVGAVGVGKLVEAILLRRERTRRKSIYCQSTTNQVASPTLGFSRPGLTSCALVVGGIAGLRLFGILYPFFYEPTLHSTLSSWQLQADATKGRMASVLGFLMIGADENAKRAALCAAAERGNINTVDLLLTAGVSSKAKNAALAKAAGAGYANIVDLLLDEGAQVNSSDELDRTPLTMAVLGGQIEIVKLLLDKGSVVDFGDADGRTALMHAAQLGYAEIVRILLNHQANLKLTDRQGHTALFEATENGHAEVVKILLNHSDYSSATDETRRSALNLAAKTGQTDIALLLLGNVPNSSEVEKALLAANNSNNQTTAGVLLASVTDKNSRNLMLKYAAEKGHINVLGFLLDSGIDVNMNLYGQTALMSAVETGQIEAVKLLLKKGARVNATDENGSTALNYTYNQEIIQLLKKAGGRYGKPLPECGC